MSKEISSFKYVIQQLDFKATNKLTIIYQITYNIPNIVLGNETI